MFRALFIATLLPGAALYAAPERPSRHATEILERRCILCHGPSVQQGQLDLSARAGALQGGTRGPALAPGDPAGSLLVARVLADEMPPGAPLPADERQELREWVAAGAGWPEPIAERRAGLDWWSLQPLSEPAPSTSDSAPPDWQASAIDQWVFSSLAADGLHPAPPAGRRDLIRRISYTLTGLPPEPAQIEAFLHDASPNAYEKLVDRLLASPHYGERWARHWLDLVRFAESEGFERDLPREHAWPYRDYLIRSFNDDKPYRRFAIEQLAGDVAKTGHPRLDRGDHDAHPGSGRCGGPDFRHRGREGPDPRRLARGHAGHDHPDFPGPHRELRPLSRSQVRPDRTGRVLPDEGGIPSCLAPDPASA